jgi:cytochrome c
MNHRPLLLALALAATASLGNAADVKNGAAVFKKCMACHTATEAKNRVGPNLVNLVGRPVATVEGFKYSKAMSTFGTGKTWDEALLTTYLAAPRQVVKGTTMAFAGLKKPTDIADVIAYLKDPAAAK